MKLPFIEFTTVEGSKIYVNRIHIKNILCGNNKCFVEITGNNKPIEVQEKYDAIKTRLYE